MMMKKIVWIIWLLILGIGIAIGQKELPEVKVENMKGELIEIQDVLKDSLPVVISFWGTTCKPCLMELDAIAEQYEEWQETVAFKVVAVATDDSRAASKVRAMAGGRGWPFEVVLDKNQDLKRAMNINSIPFLYVLDRHGRIVYTHSGYTPGSELEVLEVLKTLK